MASFSKKTRPGLLKICLFKTLFYLESLAGQQLTPNYKQTFTQSYTVRGDKVNPEGQQNGGVFKRL